MLFVLADWHHLQVFSSFFSHFHFSEPERPTEITGKEHESSKKHRAANSKSLKCYFKMDYFCTPRSRVFLSFP